MTEQVLESHNKFFKEVILEEDSLDKEAEQIRMRIAQLLKEIEQLEKNDVFYYRQRKYCRFSDGYNCEFSGDCTHKKDEGGFHGILFGIKCLAEEHARKAELRQSKQEEQE